MEKADKFFIISMFVIILLSIISACILKIKHGIYSDRLIYLAKSEWKNLMTLGNHS